jgi:hypothetical protein
VEEERRATATLPDLVVAVAVAVLLQRTSSRSEALLSSSIPMKKGIL